MIQKRFFWFFDWVFSGFFCLVILEKVYTNERDLNTLNNFYRKKLSKTWKSIILNFFKQGAYSHLGQDEDRRINMKRPLKITTMWDTAYFRLQESQNQFVLFENLLSNVGSKKFCFKWDLQSSEPLLGSSAIHLAPYTAYWSSSPSLETCFSQDIENKCGFKEAKYVAELLHSWKVLQMQVITCLTNSNSLYRVFLVSRRFPEYALSL